MPSVRVSLVLIKPQVAQDHATQLSKLKAAREEAEAKQVRMQKETREDVERLKTQYIFKVKVTNYLQHVRSWF